MVVSSHFICTSYSQIVSWLLEWDPVLSREESLYLIYTQNTTNAGHCMVFLGLQTHCNQWIKCHTVVTLHFLTKTLMGTTEEFI